MFKHLMGFFVAVTIIIVIACASYLTFSYLTPVTEKPVSTSVQQFADSNDEGDVLIKPGTIIREERKYECGDAVTDYQGPAHEELQGLSEGELKESYPKEENWKISKLEGEIIVLSKHIDGLCEEHSNYKHLGIHDDMLAIYKGPLGYDEEIERVERNIRVEDLPGKYRSNLQKAMNFEEQDYSTKLDLKKEFEFHSDEELNTVLETFDEY